MNSPLMFFVLSGRPGSNRRPTAWKAVALPTELRPHIVLSLMLFAQGGCKLYNYPSQTKNFLCGGKRIRTSEDISQQIYSLPQLAALVFPQNQTK